jgi:RNA-binding protein with serine-rich domain 1
MDSEDTAVARKNSNNDDDHSSDHGDTSTGNHKSGNRDNISKNADSNRNRSNSNGDADKNDKGKGGNNAEGEDEIDGQEADPLHVCNLTRNVRASHLKEIFGHYGKVTKVELQVDKTVGLSRGAAFITFARNTDAEQAVIYLNGGQIDGNVMKVSFVLVDNSRKAREASLGTHYVFNNLSLLYW